MAAFYIALLFMCLHVQADVSGMEESLEIDLEQEEPTEAPDPKLHQNGDSLSAKQGHCSYTFTVPTSDGPCQSHGELECVQKDVAALNDWKYQVSSTVGRMEERIDQVAKWTDNLDNKVEKSDHNKTIENVAALEKQQEETTKSLKELTMHVQSLNDTLNKLVTEMSKQQASSYKLGTINADEPGRYPRDCEDVYQGGYTQSGVYLVQPDVSFIVPKPTAPPDPFPLYCIMQNNTGWTMIQKREDGFTNFDQGWRQYKQGFGHLNREFWLGNEKIYFLTNQKRYKLRVEMEDWSQETAYAEYDQFVIEDESESYRLRVGGYSGTAGNAFVDDNYSDLSHHDRQFQTREDDCATSKRGGWWYFSYAKGCQQANLNGQYASDYGTHRFFNYGIVWRPWRGSEYSLQSARMMIAPVTNQMG